MKKTCKRKHYALVNPITYAIEGARITSGTKLDQLRNRELSAIEAFATGRAGLQEWSDLSAMHSLAETMARAGCGVEVLAVSLDAQEHLIDAAKRFESTKRMGFTGPGLHAMRELYQYHDLQRTSIALSEYEKHINRTANLKRCGGVGVIAI